MKNSIHRGKLLLINFMHPLLEGEYEPDLEKIPGSQIYMEKTALYFLRKIIDEIGGTEKIVPVSGYRSRFEQEKIYKDSLMENGEDFTQKYVAKPGHSEHESGLAIDLALKRDHIDFIRPHFPYEGICQEFRNKAPLYGFIERYPQDKEEICKISQEPWHFRYLGYPHSKIIFENNLCLEEYIDFIKNYSKERPLNFDGYQVYFLNSIENSEDTAEFSGNNVDGFIASKKL